MAVKATPRPVSGEIMTAGVTRQERTAKRDVVDADVIAVTPAPASTQFAPSRQTPEFGLTMLTAAGDSAAARRAGALFWTAGLTLAVSAFWISGGYALAPAAPAITATGGLKIAHVETGMDTRAGRTTLAVDGEVHNGTQSAQPVPPIGIAVTANNGRVTHYTLSTNVDAIAAGDIYLFSSRLRVAPGEVKSVQVTLQPVE